MGSKDLCDVADGGKGGKSNKKSIVMISCLVIPEIVNYVYLPHRETAR
jgi:hypothetical protein